MASRDRASTKSLPALPLAWLVIALAVVGFARPARAFTIQTQVTKGCHEGITEDALRHVRSAFGTGAPTPSTSPEDDALIGDVAFTVPDDLSDIGSVTLVLGVRDNDVKNLAPTALDQLAQTTADPAAQREHCLRSTGQSEPDGSRRAIDDCRAFIKERLLSALDGLGPDGKPDPNLRDQLETVLALRGRYTVAVPRFWVRLGQAVHALQDSFTHSFRTTDGHRVTVVLDWIEFAEGTLDERVDGPPHLTELDRCDDPDDLRALRHRLAIEASATAMQIALDPTLSRDQKSAAFDRMLDEYVSYDGSGHCSVDDDWCHAPENAYRSSGCLCTAAPRDTGTTPVAAVFALCALVVVRRFRRWPFGLLASLAFLSFSPSASADDESKKEEAKEEGKNEGKQEQAQKDAAEQHKNPIAVLTGPKEPVKLGEKDETGAFFGHAAAGASYDHSALSFTLGAKYQAAKLWMVGVDAEWNPWLPTSPLTFRAGSANVYASLVRRHQMAYERVNFRTTVSLGASMLLINLPGARRYSTGPLLGISFLGLEWKMARGIYLVVDPTYLVIPVPHMTGTPLAYTQYRFQVGVELGG